MAEKQLYLVLKNSKAPALVILLSSLFVCDLCVVPVNANFVPYPVGTITDIPTIIITSPSQNATYNPQVDLTFSVAIPDSWVPITGQGETINAGIINNITYCLDNNKKIVLYTDKSTTLSEELPKKHQFSITLNNLPVTCHNVTVTVNGQTTYYLDAQDPWSLTTTPISVSQTLTFDVTSSPQTSPTTPEFPALLILAALAAATVSLTLAIKNKHQNKNLQKQ